MNAIPAASSILERSCDKKRGGGLTTSVQFLLMAAWTENTTLSFHIDDGNAESDHGSCSFGDHAMIHADGMKTEGTAFCFPKFLEPHFLRDNFVLSSMDIAGAE